MLWELDQAPEVMRWYREFITQAPDDINGFFALLIVPPGPPFPEHLHNKNMCGIVWCYTGPMEKAEEAFKPIRGSSHSSPGLRGPDPASSAPEHVRCALPARAPVVLESGLCERAERRGNPPPHASTAPRCRLCTRPCTSIRSTEQRTGWANTTRRGATATPPGPR